jgi:nucleotide-binding universal stress UspA family protein
VLEPGGAIDEATVDPPPEGGEATRRWLAELCERSSGSDLPALTPVTLEQGRPAAMVLELAERERFDLIVVGRTGRHGLEGFVFGSVAERIVRKAPCSAAVVPAESSPAIPPRVLVGHDGSEPSMEALRIASLLAAAFSAGLLVVHVVPFEPLEYIHELNRKEGESLLQDACSIVSAPLESVESELREGDPRSGLLEAAREYRPRLLVLGHRGSGGFPGLNLGSIAAEVVREAECPVLVVKSTGVGEGGQDG